MTLFCMSCGAYTPHVEVRGIGTCCEDCGTTVEKSTITVEDLQAKLDKITRAECEALTELHKAQKKYDELFDARQELGALIESIESNGILSEIFRGGINE